MIVATADCAIGTVEHVLEPDEPGPNLAKHAEPFEPCARLYPSGSMNLPSQRLRPTVAGYTLLAAAIILPITNGDS